ncbi:myo-inositol transporter 1A-like isoform X15 [Beta vulgaris subsp. vulgaris]|uniref:myo-inositol transporter 1A-like isoform X15 n=1 Tax=Beta vulgaris subsp. vulgaris TaxID=3555 RepID=UPI002546C5CA|nr:myo-inositol transporter 1A-like isoform X15 [Beta vulgaris subsp. vulgaris]
MMEPSFSYNCSRPNENHVVHTRRKKKRSWVMVPGRRPKEAGRRKKNGGGQGELFATSSLMGMLTGRFLVGIGMGLGPAVAALYGAEVAPTYVRGTFGSFTQIATCLGLMASFLIGVPAKETKDWWRVCFCVPVVPAALLAISIELCAESPHWLFKFITSSMSRYKFQEGHFVSPTNTMSRSGRGPIYGMRGLAVLPFEDNPLSKIGVIFDEIVHGGVFLAFSP